MHVYERVHAGMHVCMHACVGKAREKIPGTPVSSNQCSQGCRIGSMLQAHWLEPQVDGSFSGAPFLLLGLWVHAFIYTTCK